MRCQQLNNCLMQDFLDVDGDDSFNASLRALQGTGSSLLLQVKPSVYVLCNLD